MTRTELFDKILNHLIDNPNNFWNLIPTCEKYFGVTDRRLIESIGDEIIERGWATPKKDDKYSVYIHYDGIEMMKKLKSYSSFIRFENKRNKSGIWSNRLTTAKTIITIITTLGMFILGILKFTDNKKIDSQQTEIETLKKTIDSLKTELKKRHTTTAIIQRGDSSKTKNINNN